MRERVDRGDGPEPARLRREAFCRARREIEAFQIALEPLLDAGPQDLHRDRVRAAIRLHEGLVHLRDGGRRDGRAELAVDGGPRLAESGFDFGFGLLRRKGGKPVAQRAQGAGKLRTDHVGARREKLAELDIAWAKRRNRTREPLALALCSGAAIVVRIAQYAQRPRQRNRFRHEPNAVPGEGETRLG